MLSPPDSVARNHLLLAADKDLIVTVPIGVMLVVPTE